MHVGTGKAGQAETLLEGLARGRNDHDFFWHFFLARRPHAGQNRFLTNATATVNVLATANRYGKTTLLSGGHFHACIYKIGGEEFYLDPSGAVDLERFVKLRYNTVHTAGLWETAALVWDEHFKLWSENVRLQAFVACGREGPPRSKPPHTDFINGARWKFRTLGDNASNVDGNSFHLISIDEAGWEPTLEEMMGNVLRVRVADVRGRIWIVGTFKPGIAKDFYKYAVRASAYTGSAIGFAHGGDTEDTVGGLDASIRAYLREYGINLDEYADALKGRNQ